jgi:hypothetical protein
MYREKYGKKTAASMFAQGHSKAEVERMLVEEGAIPEQVAALATKYYKTHILLRADASRRRQKQAGMFITVGIVFAVGSLLLSALTYLLIDDGQSFVAYYGILAFGLMAIVKGVLDKRSALTELNQAP